MNDKAIRDKKERVENLAEALHTYYLEVTSGITPGSFNQRAQMGYKELTEEQKSIDRYIARKVVEIVDAKVELARQDERSKFKKAIVKEYDLAEDLCDNDAMAVIKQILQRLFA